MKSQTTVRWFVAMIVAVMLLNMAVPAVFAGEENKPTAAGACGNYAAMAYYDASGFLHYRCETWAEYQLRVKRQSRNDVTDAFNRAHYAGTKLRNNLDDGWNTIKPRGW